MIKVKPIHPSKLNLPAMQQELEDEANSIADDIMLDFLLTTGTWEHDVKFEKIVQVGPDSIEILVDTDDEIYGYVNNGTRPHVILPKKEGGVLAFPSAYSAKTTPGIASSHAGGSSGETVFAKGVLHPGTEARKFDEIISKDWEKRFKSRLQEAMKRVAVASGHGYTSYVGARTL